ncbi:TRASH domain-containing protein [Halogranum amylolyticum]|uniref:TRASH domain-containing protein n=1 Tax=Halogranum amylolyticum TaxID=660520 RepID=A0A1H8WJ56_9EURY|nr:winged helix-turn-helix transcriptional regulator [Halogranum amylolyticum]SEP27700.1 TRASH domain-containing protein [Halogranum amylolyticum]
MGQLDDIDMRILELLIEDSRQTYDAIGEEVDLSSPAVSNRIDRLRERGLIRRFTVDVDRSLLIQSNATLVELQVRPTETDAVVEELRAIDSVEYLIRTSDARVTLLVHLPAAQLRERVVDVLDEYTLLSYEVRDVVEADWSPQLGATGFEVKCAECEKPIRGQEVTIETDDRTYYLCCPSCESLFLDRYERFSEET